MSKPIGRPKGGKNPPDPLRQYLPGPAIKRKQEERRGKKYISSLGLDTISHTVLKLHAYRRQVHMSVLISDILNLWMAAQTDYDQALFKEVLPRNSRAALVPERWAGYIESLGFAPPAQDPPTPAPPPIDLPGAAAYTPPQERTLVDLATPYRHPLASQGEVAYRHPEPAIPIGAGLFINTEDHPYPGNDHLGQGNMAQRLTTDQTQDDPRVQYSEEVEALRRKYGITE